MSDELDEKIMAAMPWLPEMFAGVGAKIENLDIHEPTTFVAEMEGEFNAIAGKALADPPPNSSEQMLLLLADPRMKVEADAMIADTIRELERQAAEDDRHIQILRLIGEADARVPLVSSLVLRDHADFRPQMKPICAPLALLHEATTKRGERRATILMEALGRTVELLYAPYMRSLWRLTYFARGKWFKEVKNFGALVDQVAERLSDYPGLVEPRAGWMRNASRHERWRFVPGEDAVEMHDERTAPTKVSLAELEAAVISMYRIAGPTMSSVARLYWVRDVNSVIWEAYSNLLPTFAKGDEGEILAAERACDLKFKGAFGPLNDFMIANGQPGMWSQSLPG